MEFLVWLFFLVIGLIILYVLVQAAIDNSKTADEITEIRKLLQKLVENTADTKAAQDYEEPEGSGDIPLLYDTCPACGEKLSVSDAECPSCGLALRKE